MRKSRIAIAILASILGSSHLGYAQVTREHPYRTAEVCGLLQSATQKKNKDGSIEQDEKTLRHIKVRLYKHSDDPCCAASQLVEERESSIWGIFRFRTKATGNYWVVVNWAGKDRFLPAEIAPAERFEGCEKQYFTVMPDGTVQAGTMIEVD